MIRATLTFVIVLFFMASTAQVTVTHDIPWKSDTVGMWGPSSSVWSINQIDTLFDIEVGPYGDTYSFVYNFGLFDSVGVILDYGAYFNTMAVFEMTGWHSGSVYVNYPTKIEMDFPTPGTVSNGEWFSIESDYREHDTTIYPSDMDKWELFSTWPTAGVIRLYLNVDIEANLDVIYSDFSNPFDIEWDTLNVIEPVDIDLDTFDIFLIDVPNAEYLIPWVAYHTDAFGNTVIDSVYFLHDSLGWPIEFPDIFYELIGISGSIDIPYIQTTDWIEDEQRLYAWGNDEYLHLNLDIVKFIQCMCHYLSNIPSLVALEQVSQMIDYEEGDTSIFIMTDPLSGEDFTIDAMWDLIDAELLFTSTMNQTLSFVDNQEYSIFGFPIPPNHYPNVWNVLDFPVPVDYRVYDLTSTMIEEGSSDIITYGADYDVDIKYPCFDYPELPVTISHTIDPWLTNLVQDTIDVDFYLKVLEFSYSVGTPSNPIMSGSYLAFQDTFNLGSFAGPPLFGPPIFMPWEIEGYFPDTTFIPDYLIEPDYQPLTIEEIIVTDILCFGQSTGELEAVISGGIPPYEYAWSDGVDTVSTDQLATGLPAGTYYLTVTDGGECSVTGSASITDSSNPEIFLTVTGVDVLCHGENTGSATAIVSGGTPGYTYLWDPSGAITATATNLYTGWHYVTIADAIGCEKYDSIFIDEPATYVTTTISGTDISCFEGSDGTVSLTVSDGIPPYTFNWSNGSHAEDLTGLTAGIYSVTVFDANGCDTENEIELTQPDLLEANIDITDVSCFGETDGAADLTITGGTMPYSQIWSNGAVTEDISGLAGGNYSVTVTDDNSCIATAFIFVTQPDAPLTAVLAQTPVNCFGGNDGSIDLEASGGTPPYSYDWSNGASTQNILNLTAGNYQVTVTDDHNCTFTTSIEVTQPDAPLSVDMDVTNVLCYGGHDGAIDVTVNGGTPPYSYIWNNGHLIEDIDMLYAGTYFITVTDENGCHVYSAASVTEPDPVIITASDDIHLCYGQDTILHAHYVMGGNPPVTFHWSDFTVNDTIYIDPVTTSSYSVFALDANNCHSNTEHMTVTVDPPLYLSIYSNVDTVCPGEPVYISGVINGGGGMPYNVFMNDTIEGHLPMTYIADTSGYVTITVWDACHFNYLSDSVYVENYELPNAAFVSDTKSGCQPLTVQFNALYPLTGQTYYWDFDDDEVENLSLDDHPQHIFNSDDLYDVTLVILSPDGCYSTYEIEDMITVYPKPIASFIADPPVVSLINPVITFENNSVDNIFNFWDFGDGGVSEEINPTHDYREVDDYTVELIVESQHGCLDTAYLEIKVSGEYTFYAPEAFTPDFNSANDYFIVKGTGISEEGFQMLIYDRWGEKIFESDDIEVGWNGQVKNNEIAPNGVYSWIVFYYDNFGNKHEEAGHLTLIRK
ncbi:MAG TPA: hypothetical protein DEA97_14580 [Bacteroidales bacterium]|nr:hypothetical protein [Bacteroidales bacterium]